MIDKIQRSGNSFVHLDVHSCYNYGSCRPNEIVGRSAKLNMPAVALTDLNTLGGAIEFQLRALRYGIKPIIGCSLDIRENCMPSGDKLFRVVLLVVNNKGYLNLCKLISLLTLDGCSSVKVIERKQFLRNCSGLICLSSNVVECVSGKVKKIDKRSLLEYRQALGGENFFFSVTPPYSSASGKEVFNENLSYARELGIPPVATNRVIYIDQEDAGIHEMNNKLRNGIPLRMDEMEGSCQCSQYYFKSGEQMRELFKELPEAADNTVKIAERCEFKLDLFLEKHRPTFETWAGEEASRVIFKECAKNIERLYGKDKRAETESRLAGDIEIIKNAGLEMFFPLIKDLVDYSKSQGIIFIPSFPTDGMMLSYLCGIADADPVRYGLISEAYLRPIKSQTAPVPIFLCSPSGRNKIWSYLKEKYKNIHVPASYVKYEVAPEIMETPAWKNTPRVQINGLIIDTVPSSAAIMLADRKLNRLLPIIRHEQTSSSIVQYPADDCERIGMRRVDVLGLEAIGSLERILDEIHLKTGKKIDLHEVNPDDPKVFSLFDRGDTDGIWEFELPQLKEICRKAGVDIFEDLLTVLSLCRLGTDRNIPEFIERKKCNSGISGIHPVVDAVLRETYGLMIYREQMIRIYSTLSGVSFAEADIVRQNMGSKKTKALQVDYENFTSGCSKKGLSLETTKCLWEFLSKNSACCFLKKYAVTHSLLAYRMAYLKTYYRNIFDKFMISANKRMLQ